MRQALAGTVLAALLVSCGGAPATQESPTLPGTTAATNTPTSPEGGVSLAGLGLGNGPRDVWLPSRVVIVEQVDLVNNVTLVLAEPAGEELASWLRQHLPAAGYEITADGQNSLLFHKEPWQGAFTVTGEYSALSLRTDRE
ncbi:MAG: hypothetical protein Q4D96_12150 [Propionibacteriaceae bacterium]|nr:hypothetical protein [Propionibacteriaceae bacterium]